MLMLLILDVRLQKILQNPHSHFSNVDGSSLVEPHPTTTHQATRHCCFFKVFIKFIQRAASGFICEKGKNPPSSLVRRSRSPASS
jgi:hypothetical protein